MLIAMLRAKIANARITEAELYYEGSITIDETILKSVDILPGEKVDVLNVNNGSRIETYVIAGKKNSGIICLNGPAARCGCIGDKLIILSYGLIERKDFRKLRAKIVYLDDKNKIKN